LTVKATVKTFVDQLAAWMALERQSFSLADRFAFIVTVNKGIKPPDF